VDSPSWISAAIDTDRGSPFLKLAHTHVDEGVHFVEKCTSAVN